MRVVRREGAERELHVLPRFEQRADDAVLAVVGFHDDLEVRVQRMRHDARREARAVVEQAMTKHARQRVPRVWQQDFLVGHFRGDIRVFGLALVLENLMPMVVEGGGKARAREMEGRIDRLFIGLLIGAVAAVAAVLASRRSSLVAAPRSPRRRALERALFQLETRADAILSELRALPRQLLSQRARSRYDWGPERDAHIREMHRDGIGWLRAWNPIDDSENADWLNFGLVLHGRPLGRNAEACPVTVATLLSLPVPVLVGGFSLMRPHTVIHKHTDRNVATSRSVHLGVDVPGSDDCLLTVHEPSGIRQMVEKRGRAFAFDARNPHWAVNFASEDRTILYVDVDVG